MGLCFFFACLRSCSVLLLQLLLLMLFLLLLMVFSVALLLEVGGAAAGAALAGRGDSVLSLVAFFMAAKMASCHDPTCREQ